MKFLITMFTNDQEINIAEKMHQEKCHHIVEEGFNLIYNETVNASSEYKRDIKTATVKGALVGATVVGLIGVCVLGYTKFSNYRNLKKIKEEEEA